MYDIVYPIANLFLEREETYLVPTSCYSFTKISKIFSLRTLPVEVFLTLNQFVEFDVQLFVTCTLI